MERAKLLEIGKPILFNTEMVRAILDDRKTVTRRLVKPQPQPYQNHQLGYCIDGDKCDIGKYGFGSNECGGDIAFAKPPYSIGDILYVRETWCEESRTYYYRADFDSDCLEACETLSGGYPSECRYYPSCEGCMRTGRKIKWRPSIHMPKKAARIFLEVVNVEVEHLQDITEEQAEKEGAVDNRGFIHAPDNEYTVIHTAREHFKEIWNSTIKKQELNSYGWDANPMVWVIELKVIKKF